MPQEATAAALPAAASAVAAPDAFTVTSMQRFGSAAAFDAWQQRMRHADAGQVHELADKLDLKSLGGNDAGAMAALQAGGGAPAALPETAAKQAVAGALGVAPGAISAMASKPDAEPSITNNQVQGVDEGDIVKTHGDQLVVLRRGRLFSMDLQGEIPRALDAIDIVPGGTGGMGAWYDEMLIDGDTILVIGYAYAAAGTEVHSFSIDAAGKLALLGTAVLRSQDYFSSRNYASRLVGHTLVMYVPIPLLAGWGDNRGLQLPAQKRDGHWRDLIGKEFLYRPVQHADLPVVHAVIRCDVRKPEFECVSDAIVGPEAHEFFVSSRAVYLWVSQVSDDGARPDNVCYRVPLDGQQPTAARVLGNPWDQLSFDEGDDGSLDVLVERSVAPDFGGEWKAREPFALVHLPASAFASDLPAAVPAAYRPLPGVGDYSRQNRWIGNWLLYGSGGSAFGVEGKTKYDLRLVDRRTGHVQTISFDNGIDRIDKLGTDAVVVGSQGNDLHFAAVDLAGGVPHLAGHYVQRGAAQGESRTHGFFYHPVGPRDGLLGLPITKGDDGGEGLPARGSKASVLFLSVKDLQFAALGSLTSSGRAVDDYCQASCTDWYGNARPIFWKDRIWALLGYELVQGRLQGGQLVASGRLQFMLQNPALPRLYAGKAPPQ